MRPDKCGKTEPVRTLFDPADISTPVQWLAEPHGEFFYLKGNPVHASGEMWNLIHPATARFPSPLFSNYWTGRFDGKWADRIGNGKVEEFVSEMFRVTHSDFGLLTTEVDLKAKNTDTTSYSYQGVKLEFGVPGLYRINMFSSGFAKWLGVETLPQKLVTSKELPGGGVSLRFCEFPERCRDFEILKRQRAAIEWLGPGKFFNISFPNRKLESPNWSHIPTPRVDSEG